jgi:hypothetical protein
MQVAKNAPEGTTILAMLPDTGERYLSTHLFSDIAEVSITAQGRVMATFVHTHDAIYGGSLF